MPKKYFLLLFLSFAYSANAQKDSTRIKALLDKAYGYEDGAPKKALKIYKQTYALSVKDHYWIGAFKSLQYSGLVHSDNGNYDSALYYYSKSRPYALKANYPRGEAQTYTNTGNAYHFKGDYPKAIALYLSGIKIFETIKDSAALSRTYQNLSGMYTTINHEKLTLFYLRKAIDYSSGSNAEQRGLLYADIASTLLGQKKTTEAMVWLQKMKTLLETNDSKALDYFYNRNMGEYFTTTANIPKAITYYEKAATIAQLQKDMIQHNDLLYTLAKRYFEIKNYDKALQYGLESIKTAKSIGAKELLMKSYKITSIIYENTQDKNKAYFYLLRSSEMKDSVLNENHLKEISTIETKFQTEKKDKSIAEQQIRLRKNQVELLERQTQAAFASGAILLLILLLFAIWFFFRQRQRNKNKEILALQQKQEITKLEALIDGEEKERRRIAQELHDGINGDLSAIKFRISSLGDSDMNPDDRSNLMKVIEMIDQSCAQVRNISHNLMPASIVDFGLVETVQQYCSKIGNANHIVIDFQHFGDPAVLPKKAETVIYRIIQELINNIVKHSKATTALVQMNFHESDLFITVEDNGVGFDIGKIQNGIGLKNIHSRVRYLNAKLEIDSSSAGTSFQINIDLKSLKND